MSCATQRLWEDTHHYHSRTGCQAMRLTPELHTPKKDLKQKLGDREARASSLPTALFLEMDNIDVLTFPSDLPRTTPH